MAKKTIKIFSYLTILFMFAVPLAFIKAAEEITNEEPTDITASDVGLSETEINNAATEDLTSVETSGTLIEIGNTTAEETTVVVRMDDGNGGTVDNTLEVNTKTTEFTNEDGGKSDLSDWIAGDTLKFTATKNQNSGELNAEKIKNRAMRKIHKGINGWIKTINVNAGTIDVEWGKQIFTLNVKNAKMVAGVKNPATINDLKVGDRIRVRVEDDGDKNPATWKVDILVVLRRGNSLFMRITRWVVPAKIVSMPEDISSSTTITVEILPSKFYQQGDVNNLIGAPGTQVEVDITNTTALRRRFLGKCFVQEFSEADNLQIIGRLNEATGHLDAKMIKNNTIQRLGVSSRIATVTNVANDSLEAHLIRGAQTYTIKLAANTEVYRRGSGKIQLSEIKVGDNIRVRGTLNRKKSTINANIIVILNPEAKN